VHNGLVLVTKEGALVIDPGMTCTATGLRDEIKQRFNVPVFELSVLTCSMHLSSSD